MIINILAGTWLHILNESIIWFYVLAFDSTGSSQMVLKYTFDNMGGEMLKVTNANMNVFDSTGTSQMELKYTFDNMGGEMLEVAVANMNAFGSVTPRTQSMSSTRDNSRTPIRHALQVC